MNRKTHISPFPLSQSARLLFDEPLAPVTSFRIGGPAEYLLIPATVEDVRLSVRWAVENGLPWRVIGSGTNILVPDAGLPGLTLKFWHHFTKVVVAGNCVRAQAGADMLSVAVRAAEAGLSGLEWCCGIPGTVGGSVYMNAGVKDAEIKDTLAAATVLSADGSVRELDNAAMEYRYRTSVLQKNGGVVLEAVFSLLPGDSGKIYGAMNRHLEIRKASQPINLPNCGSVFRNPPGDYAGRLIEAAGLKGFRIGGVKVSEQHANFIVNCGDGRAEDVLALVRHVQETIRVMSGHELELELRLLQ